MFAPCLVNRCETFGSIYLIGYIELKKKKTKSSAQFEIISIPTEPPEPPEPTENP